jgi:hypothetical protein
MTDETARRGATSAQLRDDIDSGRTGDKAPGFDPAAAPLGTDEEAGGTPPSPELIARARAAEARITADPRPNAAEPALAPDARVAKGASRGAPDGVMMAVLVGLLVVIVASLVAFVISRSSG